jgi:hypothetical protein
MEMPMPEFEELKNSPTILFRSQNKWLEWLILLLFLALFFFHFFLIWKYAVDIPVWDEWRMFNASQLPSGSVIHAMTERHNEHRLVTTDVLVWGLFFVNGWNVIAHQVINFAVYGLLLASLIWFARKAEPRLSRWVILCFMIFLLSPAIYGNHYMSFQSQIHFVLLFFLISVVCLFSASQSWPSILLGTLFSILSIYSLAGGIASAAVLLISFTVYKSIHAWAEPNRSIKRRHLFQLALVVLLIATAIILWFHDYHKPSHHPALAMPHTKLFWLCFLNLLSWGFGYEARTFVPYLISALIILIPAIGDIVKRRARLPVSGWVLHTAIFGLLAMLVSIAIGRGGFGSWAAKESRFSEIGMLLIPLSVVAWYRFIGDRVRLRRAILLGIWIFCFLGFSNDWTKFSKYPESHADRMKGVRCVEDYYRNGGEANCPEIYYRSLAKHLEEAKNINVSFYRKIPKQTLSGINGERIKPAPRAQNSP